MEVRIDRASDEKAICRLEELKKEDEEWIKKQVEKLQIRRAKHEDSRKRLIDFFCIIGRATKSNTLLLITTVVIFSWGSILGINIVPMVGCQKRNDWCDRLRFWGGKTTFDVPTIKCHNTRKGTVCLFSKKKN